MRSRAWATPSSSFVTRRCCSSGGGTVLLQCPPALRGLLEGVAGVDRLLAEGEALPPFDVQAALLSLPGLLQTRLDTIPAQVPYLGAQPDRVEHWRKELEPLGGFKVGIVWQGNPGSRATASAPFPCGTSRRWRGWRGCGW